MKTRRSALLLLAALPLLAACGRGLTLVTPIYLAPGGNGSSISDRPTLDLVVRMENDATAFNPWDLMVLTVDGVDHTREVVLGGRYAILRLDPPPPGPSFVELSRRLGPSIDRHTWSTTPYTGPVLGGVDPGQARIDTTVTITGAGFADGPLRVFFGGVEGTVEASDATSITARVPADAVPGLVWVTVGDEAAEGVVGFAPLDAADAPIPLPTGVTLFACFPAHGSRETAVRVYGVAFDNKGRPVFNDKSNLRLLGVEVEAVPNVGEILSAWAVPEPGVPVGIGDVYLQDSRRNDSNRLPFTIDP